MLRVLKFYVVLLLFAASWKTSLATSPIRVVATTTVVADLVEQVGGDLVVVESLMADGVDPHAGADGRRRSPHRPVLHAFLGEAVAVAG